MKKLSILFLFLLSVVILSAGVTNPDKPLKGQWDFQLQKVWTVESAGEKPLTDIGQFVVSHDGSLFLKDYKNKINFIFDKNGKYINAFGPSGEGPGEVKRQAGMFCLEDNLLVVDVDKIHYFTTRGKYLKSLHNNFYTRRPAWFLNQNQFISVTQIPARSPNNKGKISSYNIKNQTENLLREFTFYKGGTVNTDSGGFIIMAEALSPAMILGYDDGSVSGKKRIYFGMNHSYEIDVANMQGEIIDTFSLEREKTRITRADKLKRWKNRPADRQEMIIKATPNELNHFIRLEVHNGLLFVYISDLNRANVQKIDIFSPGGKYLYRARFDLGEEFTFSGPQRYNPVIKDNHLYAVVEDVEGNVRIVKYKIKLPVYSSSSR